MPQKRPSFSKPGEKPTHCTEHKRGHYINVVTKRCLSSGRGRGDGEWEIRSLSFPRFEPISLTVDNMLEFLKREQHPNFSHFLCKYAIQVQICQGIQYARVQILIRIRNLSSLLNTS